MHFPRPFALRDLLAQIGEPDIATVAFDQVCLPVLAGPPAFLAGEPDELAGMFGEGERAVHGVVERILVF